MAVRPYIKDISRYEYDVSVAIKNGPSKRERKVTRLGYAETLALSKKRERELFYELINPIPAAKEIPSLRVFFTGRYQDEYVRAEGLAASTEYNKLVIYHRYLDETLGDIPLDQFRPEHIQQLKKGWRGRLCNDSQNIVLSVLRHTLRFAVEIGVIDRMPCTIGQVKRRRRDATPILSDKYYGFEEYSLLVHAAVQLSLQHSVIVLLGGDAGLRVGEMRAIRRSAVDFALRLLTIREQVTTIHKKDYFGPPKNGVPRVLKMTPRLARALQGWFSLQDSEGGFCGSGSTRQHDGFVVGCRADGRPLSKHNFRVSMSEAQTAAGVKGAGKLHILRHTFCSHLAMKGAKPTTIMKLAGHEDYRTTQRYMHLSPSVRDEGIDLLDADD